MLATEIKSFGEISLYKNENDEYFLISKFGSLQIPEPFKSIDLNKVYSDLEIEELFIKQDEWNKKLHSFILKKQISEFANGIGFDFKFFNHLLDECKKLGFDPEEEIEIFLCNLLNRS